jgi:hypothetical protein
VADCATEDLFAVAERITVGGVEEVDAGFERLLDEGFALLLAERRGESYKTRSSRRISHRIPLVSMSPNSGDAPRCGQCNSSRPTAPLKAAKHHRFLAEDPDPMGQVLQFVRAQGKGRR